MSVRLVSAPPAKPEFQRAANPVFGNPQPVAVRFAADRFETTRIRTADLLARALKNEGVTCVYGVPGEETLDVLDAFRKEGIRFMTTRDEEGAAFMAATYGRLTGKPGVCLTTLGPGATKLTTAAAYATLGGMPLVMITGQKPIRNNDQARFQMVDVVGMMKPLTKSARRVTEGAQVARMVREAFHVAASEKPGAVHLEIPEDVAADPVDDKLPLEPVEKPDTLKADESAIAEAARLISQAKRPLVLIGAGAKRGDCANALGAFVNQTGIAFFSTQMGKGAVSEKHPLALGTAALSSSDYLHCAVEQADLIISVGHDLQEKPPFLMHPERGPKVIHISASPVKPDPVYAPQWQVIGDPAHTLRRLATRLHNPPSVPGGWQARWVWLLKRLGLGAGPAPSTRLSPDTAFYRRAIESVRAKVNEGADNPAFPVTPQRLVADVRKAMPEDGIVALDNGMYKIWFARNYPATRPDSLLLDNALATMGAGLPSAMEAARLYPNRNVLAICGDGGFMMNSQELETAIREGLNFTVLILKDDGYGMIQWKQRAHGLPDYGLTFGNPDFVKLAESFGAKGYRVSRTDELVGLLRETFQRPGVHVIELPIDYSPNQSVMNDELKNKQCPV